jgi:Putative prokaryotic signal transducing protein
MEELIRTNDLVLISFVEALLRDAGIEALVLDQNMSVIEGSLGVLPRRVLVPSDRAAEARKLLTDANVGGELERPRRPK